MNKPARQEARPLVDFLRGSLNEAFARQGFASAELVTRWADIVGAEIAAHAEPLKLQWPRSSHADDARAATLVLRVEGPTAIEIQHLAGVIVERVNRFFGWPAVGRIALRQAPLSGKRQRTRPDVDPSAAARLAAEMPQVEDDNLRQALARLGAAVRKEK
ncbi:MAG TPA: DciA family protein [Xanthobacteraceae bacterium]|nr:DciA family protein [Xanthobacteraceae bacterium]